MDRPPPPPSPSYPVRVAGSAGAHRGGSERSVVAEQSGAMQNSKTEQSNLVRYLRIASASTITILREHSNLFQSGRSHRGVRGGRSYARRAH